MSYGEWWATFNVLNSGKEQEVVSPDEWVDSATGKTLKQLQSEGW